MKVDYNSPEWIAMREERERKLQERWAEYDKLQVPILRELESVGVSVKSVWSLGSEEDPHKKSIPILVKHVQTFYDDWLNSGVARALGRFKEPKCWDMLVELFCGVDGTIYPHFKDGLAVALSDTATKKTMDEYIALLKDKRHGKSRILMLRKLRRLRQPEIIALIDELAEDEDLRTEIGSWKRKKAGKSVSD